MRGAREQNSRMTDIAETARPAPGAAKPKLSVLHVITDLDVGGAETMLVALAQASAEAGVVPVIASLLPGGVLTSVLNEHEIQLVEFDLGDPLKAMFELFRLARLIARLKPAVVQGWMYHGDLAALVATVLSGRRRQTKVAWGIRCSNMDLSRYGIALRYVIRLCALLSGQPDLVIANSQAGMIFHRQLGYRPKQAEIVPNGIDIERFKPDPAARRAIRASLGIAEDAIVLAHPARVDPAKDHPLFLAAMADLPDIHALLIGVGTDKLTPAPNVHLLGRRKDIPALLAAADIVVSSSAFGEGFSNIIAEGMACGLPVVATDVGDAKLIVGAAGRIVPPRDRIALVAAIRALAVMSTEERAALGQAARDRVVTEFSLDRAVARFTSLHSS